MTKYRSKSAFSVQRGGVPIPDGSRAALLHEHPASAASWTEKIMDDLISKSGVFHGVGHMCQYGMVHRDATGKDWPVLKPTRWMSTSPYLIHRLSRNALEGQGPKEVTNIRYCSESKRPRTRRSIPLNFAKKIYGESRSTWNPKRNRWGHTLETL